MITDPRLLYGTTTAGPLDPLSPQGLLQQGAAQVPTGTVETEGKEEKIKGAGTIAADRKLMQSQQDMRGAMLEKKGQAVQLEGIDQQGAEAERDEAERKQQETDALIEKENAFRASILARKRQELEDYKKTSTTKTLFEDMTPLRRFLSALAVGAGQWSATMSGSGRNSAYEIFKDNEKQYADKQEAALKLQTEKMLAAGKNDEEVLKSFQRGHELIGMGSLARIDVAKKQALALKAAVPQKAAEIDKAVAEMDKDYAEKLWAHENPYDPTKRSSTQTSSGDKSAKVPVIDTTTKQALIDAKESQVQLQIIKDFIPKNPEGWAGYQKALKESLELQMWKEGAGKSLASTGQFLGALESQIGQRLKTPAERKIARLMTPMITLQARLGDPVGVLNKDAFEKGERDLSLISASPAEIADAANDFLMKKQREYDSLVSMTPALQQILQGPGTPQPATQPTGKVGSPVKVKAIPPKLQDAAVAAVDDYSAIKAAMKAKKIQETPNLMEAMGRLVRSHQSGENDEAAAKYLRMFREREGI